MTEQGRQSKVHDGQRTRGRRLGASLSVALAVTLPPFLLIPVQIYTANPYDFSSARSDLMPILMVAGSIAAGGLTAMLLVVPAAIYRLLVAIFVGLALVTWVQGQFMVWDYGVLDGSIPEWSDYQTLGVFELLVWLLIGVSIILLRKHINGRAALIALALIMFQAIPAAYDLIRQPEIRDFHRYHFDETHKFSFSREENVIVMMLDAFQSDIFQEILVQEPEIADSLEGFTYFRNTLAGYSKTYPSVALMMSGQWYENDVPIQRFIKQSFEDRSVPAILRQAGWRVDFFPHVKRVVHVSPDIASNAVPRLDCATAQSEAGKLLDLGFFRVTPHWFKPFWLNEFDWRFSAYMPAICTIFPGQPAATPLDRFGSDSQHAALRFLENTQSFVNTNLEENAFKFYHLMIPHAPYRLDEDLAIAPLPNGADGFRRQSRATVELLLRFLDSLKAAGIYDNAMIFIVSDHGGGEYVREVNLNLIHGERDENESNNDRIPGMHLASGLPLMLVKRSGASGEFQVSDAPVSLADIASTIANQLNLKKDFSGENVFDIEEDANRERRYLFYKFDGWNSEYLPTMTEYVVDGFSWIADNWRPSGNMLEPAAVQEQAVLQEFRVGEPIRFRPGSPHLNILGEGWSEPNADGLVWSNAHDAEMNIALDAQATGPLLARFDFLPFNARGAIDAPRIEVEANGALRHTWVGQNRKWYELRIPERIAAGSDTLNFRFHFPQAASPFEYGLSGDQRMLGIALYRLQIDQVSDKVQQ